MPIISGVVALVDDDAALLQALHRSLSAYGYRVKAYATAEQYLADADANEVSCLVIDLQLGDGLQGLDLGERVARTHATPIVFMTGAFDIRLCERARRIGCVDFLHKPFPVSTLLAALMKLDGDHA